VRALREGIGSLIQILFFPQAAKLERQVAAPALDISPFCQ